jgi:hypothetical protein
MNLFPVIGLLLISQASPGQQASGTSATQPAQAGAQATQSGTQTPPKKPKPPKSPFLGLNVGGYFPSGGRARQAFGNTWLGFGPTFGSVTGWKGFSIHPDLQSLYEVGSSPDDNNKAFVVLGGVSFRYTFESSFYYEDDKWKIHTFAPYVGFTTDLQYSDIVAHYYGVSVKTLTPAGTVYVGTTIGKNFYIEGRYTLLSSVEGFDLSGASFTVGVRF